MPTRRIVASSPRAISQKAIIAPLKSVRVGQLPSNQVVCFLLKVAALEAVRRLSKPRCPFIWQAVQALQIFCYPPFKWIQRWGPLKMIVRGAQKISRPLLFLSIATAFSGHSENHETQSNPEENSQLQHETSETLSTSDSIRNNDENPENVVSENWLIQLQVELQKQGITLPARINQDELQRFYAAANGDFSCLLSSIKKTIRWRETYSILSAKELELWSHLVFWHGFDVMLRPCLVVRLGLACASLMPEDRPRFAQAVVSQIELGVLHLVNQEDPRINVLMDCEGLSPLRFPMHMMRSCSILVQDHFPNRLATLFLVRLPPVVRIVAQTFIQVLKPATRKKLHVEGEGYLKALSEFLDTVPAFLGGHCNCSRCQNLIAGTKNEGEQDSSQTEPRENAPAREMELYSYPVPELPSSTETCEQILRAAIVALLMIWIFIAFVAGMYNPEPLSLLPK